MCKSKKPKVFTSFKRIYKLPTFSGAEVNPGANPEPAFRNRAGHVHCALHHQCKSDKLSTQFTFKSIDEKLYRVFCFVQYILDWYIIDCFLLLFLIASIKQKEVLAIAAHVYFNQITPQIILSVRARHVKFTGE